MFGTIVNVISILIGCLIGGIAKGRIPENISKTIMHGLALCVIYIGVSGSLEGENTLLIIISIAIGALIGEIIDIDKILNNLGEYFERKFSKNKDSSIAQGFITSSLLFCVGAMAIVGSLESGLTGNHDTLIAKSMLDGISAVIFTSTLGYGVMLSAITVFVYQGSIALFASSISPILSDTVITNMTAVGSLLIMGLGLNMLKITNIKIANLLPSVVLPIILSFIM